MVLDKIDLIIRTGDESFKGMQSHYEDIVKAGGERLDTLESFAVGLHKYTKEAMPLEQIRIIFATVRLSSTINQPWNLTGL